MEPVWFGVRLRFGVTRFRMLAREPSPEVAHVRHEGVVAVAGAFAAAVADREGPPGIERVVRIRVAGYPCVFYGGKHILIDAPLAYSKPARTDSSPAQRRTVATLFKAIKSAGKRRK